MKRSSLLVKAIFERKKMERKAIKKMERKAIKKKERKAIKKMERKAIKKMERKAIKKTEGRHKGVDEARVEWTEHERSCQVGNMCNEWHISAKAEKTERKERG